MSVQVFFNSICRILGVLLTYLGAPAFGEWRLRGFAVISEDNLPYLMLLGSHSEFNVAVLPFGLLLLFLSPLVGILLPPAEKESIQMNGFALLTCGLRVIGWTTFLWNAIHFLLVQFGFVEYPSPVGFAAMIVVGGLLFLNAPAVAKWLRAFTDQSLSLSLEDSAQ